MSETTHFLMVRHGETQANIDRLLAGWYETPLTERGRQQAAALGAFLKTERIDRAFCSDLERTRETAALLLAGHPELTAEPVPELREWSLGELEGASIPEYFYPGSEFARKWEDQQTDLQLPGGESRFQLRKRISGFMQRCAEKYPGEHILIVTHGAAAQQQLSFLIGTPPEYTWLALPANTGLSRFDYLHSRQRWRLISWNETAHLKNIGETASL